MNRRRTTKTVWSAARPVGLFAVAVLALSAGATLPVQGADNQAAIEESDAKMAGIVGPLLKEAISLYSAGQYEQALLKCDEINKIFKTQKYIESTQMTAQKSMVDQLRSEINAKWGSFLMSKIRDDYQEAERLLQIKQNPQLLAKTEEEKNLARNEQRAIELFNTVIDDTNKISVRIPAMKAEAMTLKSAARRYLDTPALAWEIKRVQENTRRENVILKEINPLCQEAAKLLNQKMYKRSYAKYMEANKKLEGHKYSKSPKLLEVQSQLIALRREIIRQWELAYVMNVRASYIRAAELAPKDPKQALSLARGVLTRIVEAKNELPIPSKSFDDIEQACTKLVKSQEFLEITSLENVDEARLIEARRANVEELLLKADAFYRNKMYMKARDVYEQIYILDPYNEKANIMLGKIYRKIIDTAWMRRENEILERINEVEWKWVLPSRQTTEDPFDSTPVVDETSTEKASIHKKLQDIIYPGADFEDESVPEVLAQIQRRSRELDPEKKGIPIFYPAFKEDKYVTLKMAKLPIGELIRYVCMYSGLKYKITHQGVVIGDSSLDDMRQQTFTMSNNLYDNIANAGLSTETKNLLSEDASDNPFGDDKDSKDNKSTSSGGAQNKTGASAEGTDALKTFFVECGVKFDEGSAISYNKATNKLTVKNTPDNLRTIATLLEKIDIETELVLVEAKIIEISVTDLEELGFDWTLTHNNTDPEFLFGNATQPNSSFGSSETYSLGEAVINQVLVRHVGGGGSGGNFSTEEAVSALNLINNLNIIPNFGKDGAYNMFLTVHAVDQSSRGEVIAAPKVLAKSGSSATIQMVQQMYFPEDWEEAELEEGNNTFEYTPPVPEMGDAEPIGTTFTVTPTVGSNLRTITLVLSPEVSALVGWTDYDYQFIIGSIRSVSADSAVYAAKMKMPEISKRSLSTQLKIYDGDTVVLGGVLKEQTLRRDDKYPLLGDIPLLGTLFSSKANRSVKQNLLIFVTPRLIGYNGVPVNAIPDNGRFDFHR